MPGRETSPDPTRPIPEGPRCLRQALCSEGLPATVFSCTWTAITSYLDPLTRLLSDICYVVPQPMGHREYRHGQGLFWHHASALTWHLATELPEKQLLDAHMQINPTSPGTRVVSSPLCLSTKLTSVSECITPVPAVAKARTRATSASMLAWLTCLRQLRFPTALCPGSPKSLCLCRQRSSCLFPAG